MVRSCGGAESGAVGVGKRRRSGGPRHGAGPGTGVVMNLILDRDRCAVPFDERGAVEGKPEHGESVQPSVNERAGDLDQ